MPQFVFKVEYFCNRHMGAISKHGIDIFINLEKIVRYGRHWDESCNLYILTATFPMRNCAHMTITKICPLSTEATFHQTFLWNEILVLIFNMVIYMQRLAIQFVEMHCTKTHKAYKFLLYIDQHPGNNCVLFIKLFTNRHVSAK
jgi:hypothetical protein